MGAAAELPKTTLPTAVPSKPNVGLTAEVEKSHQNQVGVIVIPQSPQPLSRTSTGSQPPPQPPIIHAYSGPSSSLGMFPGSHKDKGIGLPCLRSQVTGNQTIHNTINNILIVPDPSTWPLFLKLAYFSASRANICFKNIKFPRGNYQPIVPRQKHSIV